MVKFHSGFRSSTPPTGKDMLRHGREYLRVIACVVVVATLAVLAHSTWAPALLDQPIMDFGGSVSVSLLFEGRQLVEVLEMSTRVSGGANLPVHVDFQGNQATVSLFRIPLDSAVKLLVNAERLADEILADCRFVHVEHETDRRLRVPDPKTHLGIAKHSMEVQSH